MSKLIYADFGSIKVNETFRDEHKFIEKSS